MLLKFHSFFSTNFFRAFSLCFLLFWRTWEWYCVFSVHQFSYFFFENFVSFFVFFEKSEIDDEMKQWNYEGHPAAQKIMKRSRKQFSWNNELVSSTPHWLKLIERSKSDINQPKHTKPDSLKVTGILRMWVGV